MPDGKGGASGFDADFCRAVAAAVLGDGGKVSFVPLSTTDRFTALKSGQMAKLNVNQAAFDGVKRWLMTVAKAAPGEGSGGSGQFAYQPEGAATPTMSAVGLLCSQYLRAGRADPVIVG